MKIAIIPARGGSKRIPKKNIIPFCGHPMIYHTLKAVQDSGVFDKIHVSTDDHEIIKVVEDLGFKVDFVRPTELADDHTPLFPPTKWVVSEYAKRNEHYNTIGLILPCSPLIKSSDYAKAMKQFVDSGKKYPLISMSSFPCPTEWSFIETNKHTVAAENPEMLAVRSQDLKEKFYDTGNFLIFTKEQLFNEEQAVFSEYIKYDLSRLQAVDIDTPEDLEIARVLYHLNQGNI